jgi:4'-phosphopantetheinyl transferase EntD
VKIIEIQDTMLGIAPIERDPASILNRLSHVEMYLSSIEKMPIRRRCEWLSVRLLIREILGEEKEILYRENGKPYIADGSYNISISHTKGYVAVILNPQKRVAIDIETISPRVKNVMHRFMSNEELENTPLTGEIVYWLLHWSAKESVFKYIDESGVDFREHIYIAPFKPLQGEWGIFHAQETKTAIRETFAINYYIADDFVLTAIG